VPIKGGHLTALFYWRIVFSGMLFRMVLAHGSRAWLSRMAVGAWQLFALRRI
jgi:hypothetical protein